MSEREQQLLEASVQMYKRRRGEEVLTSLSNLVEGGSPKAFSMLGTLYETGCGTVEPNADKAVGFYLRSIEVLDDVNSHLGVSRVYLENPSLDPNRELVRYHLELLASNEIAGGLYGLGLLHQHGLGIPKDLSAALSNFQRAADSGHLGARIALFQIEGSKGFLSWIRLVMTVMHFKVLEIVRPSDPRLGLS